MSRVHQPWRGCTSHGEGAPVALLHVHDYPLHHAAYAMHHAQCTMPHAPCTMHHAPYTIAHPHTPARVLPHVPLHLLIDEIQVGLVPLLPTPITDPAAGSGPGPYTMHAWLALQPHPRLGIEPPHRAFPVSPTRPHRVAQCGSVWLSVHRSTAHPGCAIVLLSTLPRHAVSCVHGARVSFYAWGGI